ncbi:MAG: hypothetical protein QNK37_00390 [Acidobacteriota bacterium]|nr:hypothetical protein [Acidobacteriota bacterium]
MRLSLDDLSNKFNAYKALTRTILILTVISMPGSGQELSEAPSSVKDQNDWVIWVTVSEIIKNTNGTNLNRESLDMLPAHIVDQILSTAETRRKWEAKKRESNELETGCNGMYTATSYAHIPIANSFIDLVRKAPVILQAEIVGIDHGFFMGTASSVLTLKIQDKIKESDQSIPGGTIYLNYPKATFKVGDTIFCADSGFPYEPTVGQRMLVFPVTTPHKTDQTFYHVTGEKVFLEDESGKVLIHPEMLLDENLRGVESFSQLLERTRRLATQSRNEEREIQ